ncbi:hypothetical protein O6H91_05G078900 [Diphasiastrum complanatum]|uniref:Uncharacterized protein n=2 Tax=Diphasiastrum complanatum TaxID=34168 RepID=A0ACC2DQ05_DIPCM|nr:hypothetical protein O6H91_05G078900 [Diphasiastrum complanatum]
MAMAVDRLARHKQEASFCSDRPLALAHLLRCLLILVSLQITSALAEAPARSEDGFVVEGKIRIEGLQVKAANVKIILNGGQRITFIRPDGYFSFQGIPAGTHLIEVCAMGYFFSPVRVDVSARLHGQVRASLIETGRVLSDALILEPLKEEQYFEKREPFSVLGLLKSPMGLMVGFMLLAVFVLPKLMDSIDPEEMKRVQEEMRNRPAPSFSNLLQGRS